MQLRPYQSRGFNASVAELKRSLEPHLIEAATGAGKSYLVAAIAKWLIDQSGKKVLCLAPSKELTEQNHEKFLLTGDKASFFSASIGKSMRNNVIFGTPKTVLNKIERFRNFAAVIVDEAHGITPTIKEIIRDMRKTNPKLRVVGLTATPYRLGSGYIYQLDENEQTIDEANEPYFSKLVCRITAHELIAAGFLTPPTTKEIKGYKTDHLQLNKMGKFSQSEVDKAFNGRGRLTSEIIAQIVERSIDRKGVMIFAASIQHAQECCESLPPELTRLVTGKTPKKERAQILKDFKAKRIKYLVNVSVLTTGFDAPHVDVIAILRATESVALLQQIIGRGLRIDEGKTDSLVLDYAQNIARHCPEGDIFSPEITANKSTKKPNPSDVACPQCNYVNEFSLRENPEKLSASKDGYFLDLMGNKMELPSHYGRRCQSRTLEPKTGKYLQCSYRWTFKECDTCGHENDIAARICESCKAEIINPNDNLYSQYTPLQRVPGVINDEQVIVATAYKEKTKNGDPVLRVWYKTESSSFNAWYLPKFRLDWVMFTKAVFGYEVDSVKDIEEFGLDGLIKSKIKTITAKKRGKYYNILRYNKGEI